MFKLKGRVTAVHSSHCQVSIGNETVRCALRGRLRSGNAHIYPGDVVEVTQKRDGNVAVIDEIFPRFNALIRPQVVNVDQVIVVSAVDNPPIDPVYVDRVLVHLESRDIEAVVCFNKIDIEDPVKVEKLRIIYEKAGYPVELTSAVTGEGLAGLVQKISGENVVLAGASGVGKSKMLSEITHSDIASRTLSRIRRGRQTTTGVTLYDMGNSTFIADTPGFSSIDAIDCEPFELSSYYREMSKYVPLCHFPRCLHKTEDRCAVKDALAKGVITPERYKTYLTLLDECIEREKRKYESR